MLSKNRRILLIDDDERTAAIARCALAEYAVDLIVVREGATAVDRARTEKPDVIVLAVELAPQKQGYNLCRRFKKSPDLRPIPLLLLSQGDPYLEDHKKLSTRADAYLLKPFSAGDFLGSLASLIGDLPSLRSAPGEEIVELEDAQVDSGGSEATVVAEIVEDISDEDIVAEKLETPAARAPQPLGSPSGPRASFLAAEDDQSFDAMLDSLEFKDSSSPGPAGAAPAPLESLVPHPARSGPAASPWPPPLQAPPYPRSQTAPESPVAPFSPPIPTAPATPPRPTLVPDQSDAAAFASRAGDQDARERELLDYKERLAAAERQARERGERLASLEREAAELRRQVEVLGRTSSSKEKELAEEIAIRERELSEQRAQLERLAEEHAQWLERTHREHAEALARLRNELEMEKDRAVQNALQEREALEGAIQERLQDVEALHERSLAEARAEAERQREEAEKAREASEAARLRLLELERVQETQESRLEERIAAATEQVRRPLEEELGRRAEEHAHEVQALKRQHALELEAAEARAGSALAELERLTAEVRTHEKALAHAYQQASSQEAELRKLRAELAEADRRAGEREAGIAGAARQTAQREAELLRKNAELEEKARLLEARLAETQRLLSEREGELHRQGADFENRIRDLEEQLTSAHRALRLEAERKDRLRQAAENLGRLLREEVEGK